MNYASLWLVLATGFVAPAAIAAPPDPGEPLALQQSLQWLSPDAVAKQSVRFDANSPAQLLATYRSKLALDDSQLVRSSSDNSRVVQYRQEIAGIEVFGARLGILRDAAQQPRAVAASLAPKKAAAALPSFALDSTQALRQALATLQLDAAVGSAAAKASGDRYLRLPLSAGANFNPARPARIKPVWYPAGERLIAAYYAEIIGKQAGQQRPRAEALVISAEDGRILRRQSQIHDLEPFRYRVYGAADAHPYIDPYGFTSPHPTGVADGYKPAVWAPMNLLSLVKGPISRNDPWLADSATTTQGNNVDAFFNAEILVDGECYGEGWGPGFGAAEGDFRATLTGPRTFDYPYDAANSQNDFSQCLVDVPTSTIPTNDVALSAKIVQAFYVTNWLHDRFYDAGYDEAAGNAQADNYGRGGIAGDPLFVHAGYYSTFAYAPADGESGSLTLGTNPSTTSRRDTGAFDLGVIAHEWGHTMFGRLTLSAYYGQQGALNEGTADFIGLILTVREQDRYHQAGKPEFYGAYAVGAYMNLDYDFRGDDLPAAGTPGNPDNSYYHGIRRYPYAVDKQHNPLTFKHIAQDNPVPANSHPFDWKGRAMVNAEVHTAGEIWTTALWACARNVLAATPSSQFDATHQRFLGWLVDGLKLFPVDATYTEARTALLTAIRADSEADYRRCRSGFADRGMGAGAVSPERYSFSLRGVKESFRDMERALDIVDMRLVETSGDGDGVLDRNESGQLKVSLRNTGFDTLDAVTLVVPPIPGFYDLPQQVYIDNIALAPEETRELSFDFRVRSNRALLTLPVQALAWDTRHPEAFAANSKTFDVNLDLRRDSFVDSAAHAATFAADWSHEFADYFACSVGVCLGAEGAQQAEIFDWQRQRYNGVWSYVISEPQLNFDVAIATQPFTVSAGTPLELLLRHDYDLERAPRPTSGRVEIRVDDGEWEDAAAYLSSGSGVFSGISSGWRNDTLVFNASLANRRVQLRLRATAPTTYRANDVHWAVARIEVRGAAQAPFSRAVGDTQ